MSLKKEFIRDGQRRIIGSVTTVYSGLIRPLSAMRTNTSRDARASVSHDPRRTWQVRLDQHRRFRSPDRAEK